MKRKVLVVDEDASVRGSLRKVLEGAGHEVLTAADCVEAVSQFERQGVDLVLLDMDLPAGSGWDTLERVARAAPTVPIIIITSPARPLDAAVAGVGALMEKPLDVTRLLGTIETLLAESSELRPRRSSGPTPNNQTLPPDSAQILQALRERKGTPPRPPSWRRWRKG